MGPNTVPWGYTRLKTGMIFFHFFLVRRLNVLRAFFKGIVKLSVLNFKEKSKQQVASNAAVLSVLCVLMCTKEKLKYQKHGCTRRTNLK